MKRENIEYKLGKDQRSINHLLFVDDLMLCGRSEEEQESLINIVRVSSRDMQDFGLDISVLRWC